jgi:DNA-binding winged helix-turn-helix (wHTH) protein/tetratricopeptide (TPR) repeat protein
VEKSEDTSSFIRQVRFGPFEANFETGELRKHGLKVKLQEKPLTILKALVVRPGELVTREELRDRLWPKDLYVDFERNLTIAMNKLRTALTDSAEKPRYIETLPRRGYRFIAAVEAVNVRQSDGSPVASPVGSDGDRTVAANANVSAAVTPAELRPSRAWRAGVVVALFTVCLVAGAIAYFRAWSSPKAVTFRQRDWVLISQFENRTGEAVLDGTLEYALSRELSNSSFVSIVPGDRVQDALRLMRLPENTPLKPAVAREVCLRDGGIRALITGRVEKLQTTYFLSAGVVDPISGEQVAGVSAEAGNLDSVLPAVREVSNKLRMELGEKLPTIRAGNLKLEKVTTPSLHALQLYSQGMAFGYSFKWEEAATYFERAVLDDPNFASAHLLLGYTYSNLGREKEADPHFRRAFELAETTPERERLFIRCTELQRSKAPLDQIIQAYRELIRLYPDHYWGTNNLGFFYRKAGEPAQAADMAARCADLRPNSFAINYYAYRTLQTLGNNRLRAEVYRERTRRLELPGIQSKFAEEVVDIELDSAFSYWLKSDLTGAHRELDRIENLVPINGNEVGDAYRGSLGEARLSLGEIRQARVEFLKLGPSDQAYYKCVTAFVSGDDRHDLARACAKMGSADGHDYASGTVPAILLARAGLVSQAQRFSKVSERLFHAEGEGNPNLEGHLKVVRGEVALARGDARAAEKLLATGTEAIRKYGTKTFFMGMESLIKIREAKGDLTGAIQLAESAAGEKARMHEGIQDVWAWASVERRRAELYREDGRIKEAQEVESELRRLFEFADQDYPNLAGLQDLKETPNASSP